MNYKKLGRYLDYILEQTRAELYYLHEAPFDNVANDLNRAELTRNGSTAAGSGYNPMPGAYAGGGAAAPAARAAPARAAPAARAARAAPARPTGGAGNYGSPAFSYGDTDAAKGNYGGGGDISAKPTGNLAGSNISNPAFSYGDTEAAKGNYSGGGDAVPGRSFGQRVGDVGKAALNSTALSAIPGVGLAAHAADALTAVPRALKTGTDQVTGNNPMGDPSIPAMPVTQPKPTTDKYPVTPPEMPRTTLGAGAAKVTGGAMAGDPSIPAMPVTQPSRPAGNTGNADHAAVAPLPPKPSEGGDYGGGGDTNESMSWRDFNILHENDRANNRKRLGY